MYCNWGFSLSISFVVKTKPETAQVPKLCALSLWQRTSLRLALQSTAQVTSSMTRDVAYLADAENTSQAQRSPLFLVLTIQRDQTRLIGLSSWDTSTCIQQLRYTYFSGIIITWAGHSTNVGFSHILIYKGHVRLKEFGWFGGMLEEFVREKHCSGWKKKRIKPDLRARERGQRVNAPVQFVGPSV